MGKFLNVWKKVRDYVEYFLIYSFAGWIYESIWCDVIYHKRGFLNRGVLFGPWLPIYAIGFFIIIAVLNLLKIKKPWLVFIVGGLIATIAEFVASYIMEYKLGSYTWDYSTYFMNYDGRIALVPGLMFGLLICLAVCLLHPAIIKLQKKFQDNKVHNICFVVITLLFLVDLISRIWLGSNFKG